MTSAAKKNKNGDNEWRNERGELHRENGPAVENANGVKTWYMNGKIHRENGPAVEWTDGTKGWYLNGQRHRENGPAVEWTWRTKEWWVNGQTGPEIEQKVKENMARVQSAKEQ